MTITVTQKAAQRRRRLAKIGSRGDMTPIGRWFWEIDRVLLLLVTILIFIGLMSVAAASPAAGVRYSGGNVVVPALHYFWRHVMWLCVGIPVMIGVSILPKDTARRAAIAGCAVFTFCLMLVPFFGVEVNGAHRWLGVGISQFQPSEFLKPCYVVTLAWLLSLRAKDGKLPVFAISAGATGAIGVLLMLQPDFGQSVMFAAMWGALILLAGAPMKLIGGLAGGAVALVLLAYQFYSVATLRINNFLHGQGDTYQVDMAHATITGGGLFGTGPGAGVAKFRLPEPHTDYIFSVIGEEFGLIACLAVAAIYLVIVARVFVKLLGEEDSFLLYASAGLAVQFGAQAIINMAVNVGIAPSKGMTLPFISYGGSSMIALSLGFGLLLAFTRRNPFLQRSPYGATRAMA